MKCCSSTKCFITNSVICFIVDIVRLWMVDRRHFLCNNKYVQFLLFAKTFITNNDISRTHSIMKISFDNTIFIKMHINSETHCRARTQNWKNAYNSSTFHSVRNEKSTKVNLNKLHDRRKQKIREDKLPNCLGCSNIFQFTLIWKTVQTAIGWIRSDNF